MDYKTFDWENKIIQVLYSTPKMSGYYALTDAEKFPVEKGEYYLLYEFLVIQERGQVIILKEKHFHDMDKK